MATLLGMALANTGVLPHHAPELGVVYKYVLPLAIPMLLFSADLGARHSWCLEVSLVCRVMISRHQVNEGHVWVGGCIAICHASGVMKGM